MEHGVFKLLAVDDDPESLSLLKNTFLLSFPAAEFIGVSDGESALRAAAAGIDIAIVDILMPGMDGLELCRRLKAEPALRDLPVIFITASATDPARHVAALEAGGDGFLGKPLGQAELVAQVRAMLKVKEGNAASRNKAAQKASAEVEEKYRALVENIPVAIFVNRGGKVTLVNEECRRLFGASSKEQLLGLSPFDLIHPDCHEAMRGRIRSMLEEFKPVPMMEEKIVRLDGTAVSAEVSAAPFRDADGVSIHVALVDISERKENLRSLETVNSALLDLGPDPEANIQSLVGLFGRLLKADCAMYSIRDNGFLRVQAAWGSCPVSCMFPSAGTPCEKVLETAGSERGLALNDLSGFSSAKCLEKGGFATYFGCPVRTDSGEGVACVLYRRQYSPVEMDRKLMGIIASALSLEERRLAAQLSLRESEERYHAVAEYSNNAICIVNTAGKMLWVNARMTEMGAYSKEEYLSSPTFADFIAPESASFVGENFAKFASGLPYERHYTFYFVRKDGQKRLAEKYMTDYLDKRGRRNLVISMIDITDRVKAQAERERLSAAIEQAGEIVLITDPQGAIQYVNPAFEFTTGYTSAEVLGKNPRLLKSGVQDESFYRELWSVLGRELTWKGKLVNKRKDGSLFTEEATISPVKDREGKVVNYVAVKRDITAQLSMQEQLLHSQKMEAVGRLAGGMAHDFNNVLTAIEGYAGLIKAGLSQEDPRRSDVIEILSAAAKAGELTRQLLAFSRKQALSPKVFDLNSSVAGMNKMLKRLIGADISLETRLAGQKCQVKADPGQIDQVIVNLAVNARDAMPKGGVLALETSVLSSSDAVFERFPSLPRASIVRLRVTDNGWGMGDDVKARIFEPFFTTKEKGRGTGLGLSTVLGIIKQSGGEIEVESRPGAGSTFSIYLPYAEISLERGASASPEPGIVKGSGLVLLAEDDDVMRPMVERLLRGLGYTVVSAADGKGALAAAERMERPPELLLSDVVMPDMSGRELARKLAAAGKVKRVLYMSGYSSEAIMDHGVLDQGIAFIYKPFTLEDFSIKLKEVLDGPENMAQP